MSARKFSAPSPRRRSTGSLREVQDAADAGLSDPEDAVSRPQQAAASVRPASYFGGSAFSVLSERADSCADLSRTCSCEICLWDFSDPTAGAAKEKTKLKNLVMSSRKQEEEVIEQLVQCSLQVDALHDERIRDHSRIRELEAENNRLHEQLIDSLAGSIMGDRTRANGVTDRLFRRVHELELELKESRANAAPVQADGHGQDDRWKLLEIRREKMEARRELDRVSQHLGEERARVTRLRERLRRARQGRRASEAEVQRLREHLTSRDSPSETVPVHVVQEIKVLRAENTRQRQSLQDAESIRDQLDEMRSEVAGLRSRLNRLGNVEQQGEHWRRKSLTLEIENRRLQKVVEQLRRMSVRNTRYNYVTSF